MPGFIGLPEIILFLVVALLVFGPKRLPEMGRSLGKGMREFKDSVTGDDKPTAATVTALGVTEEPVDHFAHLRETPETTPAAPAAATTVPTSETTTKA